MSQVNLFCRTQHIATIPQTLYSTLETLIIFISTNTTKNKLIFLNGILKKNCEYCKMEYSIFLL